MQPPTPLAGPTSLDTSLNSWVCNDCFVTHASIETSAEKWLFGQRRVYSTLAESGPTSEALLYHQLSLNTSRLHPMSKLFLRPSFITRALTSCQTSTRSSFRVTPPRHLRMASAAPQATPQWWEAFPEVKASCPRVEAAEVAGLIEKNAAAEEGATRDFLLVDVRRTDWEGGTVATSINFPAHTFYQTRPVIYQLCKQAGIRRIIFYCGEYSIWGAEPTRH